MTHLASKGRLLPVRPPYDHPPRPPGKPGKSGMAPITDFSAGGGGLLLPLLGHAVLAGGVVAMPALDAQAAGIDSVQLKLAWQLQQPLRWDNVQAGSAYWLGGESGVQPAVPPDGQLSSQLSSQLSGQVSSQLSRQRAVEPPQAMPGLNWQVLQLAPGQRVSIRVPRTEFLRLQAVPGSVQPTLSQDDLQFWRSNGSGSHHALAVRESARSEQQGSALLLDQLVDETRVIVIERPAHSQGSLAFGVFVSRHEALGTLAPYRQLQPLALPQQQLRLSSEGAARPVWAFAAGQSTRLRVQGPARFALSGRWQYPPQDGALQADWRVSVRRGDSVTELDYSASGEHSEIARLNGQSAILSEEKTGYFEVPAGEHDLELVSSGPFLARLMQQELNDYRFANWNAGLDLSKLTPAAAPNGGDADDASGAASAPWQMTAAALQQAVEASPDQALLAARRLQQDNRHRDGGLLAAAVMENAAQARRDVPAVREQAREFAAQAMSWQDLLPQEKMGNDAPRFAWFRAPRLLDIGERDPGKVVALQHEESLLASLGSGHFFALPGAAASAAPGQHYLLPPRSATSRLQIVVQAGQRARGERLFLQFDQRAPQELRLEANLPDALFAADSASAALQLQAWRSGELGGSTVDAAFGASRAPAALVAASVLELPLPGDVKSVQLWRVQDAAAHSPAAVDNAATPATPVWAALRLRVARPFALSEQNLLPTLTREDGMAALLRAMDRTEPASSETALRQFDSQLQGLARLINAEYLLWANSVAPATGPDAATPDHAGRGRERSAPASHAAAAQEAAALAREGNWLPALEKWASVAASPDGGLREQAQQGRVQALLALGETFLAEQVLKQRLLYGSTRRIQQQAARQLMALYRTNRDPRSALTLASSALVRLQDTASLKQLVSVLLENDQPELALQAGLLLPAKQRPVPLLLQVALQKNWQILFEQLRATLPDAATREFWLGQQLARQGKLPQAATSFAISARLAAARGAGKLATQSNSATAERRAGAEPDEPAESENVSPTTFENLSANVHPSEDLSATGATTGNLSASATASENLSPTATARENLFPNLSATSAAKPDLATAFARHLQAGQDLQRRIRVLQARGQSLPEAMLAEWASWQAQHPGPQQWQEVPGQVSDFAGHASLYAINRDLVGHSYRAEPGKPLRMRFMGPLALRIEARPLHAAHTQGAIEGWFHIAEKQGNALAQMWPVAINQNWPASGLQLLGAGEQLPGQSVRKELAFGPGWHELEIGGEQLPLLLEVKTALPALPLPVLPLLTPDTARGQSKVQAQVEAVARFSLGVCRDCTTVLLPQGKPLQLQRANPPLLAEFASLPGWAPTVARSGPLAGPLSGPASAPLSAPLSVPVPASLASVLARKDWDALLAMPDPQSPDEVIDYVSALLWRSEQAPQRGQSVLARASSLQAAHPELAPLGALMERLARNSDWMPVPTVQASAGMRSRPVSGWEPETPAMRVRRAMLNSLHPEEYLLAGGNRLLLNLFNTKTTGMTVLLSNRDVGGMPPLPLTAQVQLGNGPVQSVLLQSGTEGWRLPLTLAKGQQSVKIWIKKPLANQFLGARLVRAAADHATMAANRDAPANGVPPVLDVTERFYHVATKAEPIKLLLPGPVWVRVDHWVNGQTRSRYRLLDQPWNKFSLTPRDGEQEGLYRLFTRQLTPARPVTPPRHVEVAPIPVPGPLVALDATEGRGTDVQTTAGHASPSGLLPVPARPHQGLPLFALLAGSAAASNGGQAATPPRLHDTLRLGGQEGGTWSGYGSALQAGGERNLLQFESGARYRLMDEVRHNWYRADVFARGGQRGGERGGERGREQGGARALGLAGALTHDPDFNGLQLGADATLLLRQGTRNEASTVTLGVSAWVKQVREIAPKWSHQPQLKLFLRQSAAASNPLGDAAYLSGDSDSDVTALNVANGASRRKFGLEVGDKLDYRPHLDTLLSSQVKATSGQNLAPESLALRFGGKQMLGPMVLGAQFDAARFLADGGRIPARTLRSVAFNANYERWLAQGHRLELGVSLSHDLNRHRLSVAIGVALHLGNGRGYRDFAPGEISFADLRRRRMPEG